MIVAHSPPDPPPADLPGGGHVPGDAAHSVAGDLPGLADIAEELAQLLSKPVAPVRIPPAKDLEVRLVSEQTLERLFEAEKDAGLHTNLFLLMVGTALGFFTNVVTADRFDWSRPTIAYVTVLMATSAVFGGLSLRSSRRVRRLRRNVGTRGDPR